jgi:hypothetical protein
MAVGDAIEEHGNACDRLYDELYRQLDERTAAGKSVPKWQPPPDVREEMRKKINRALKADLSAIIAAAVEDIIDQRGSPAPGQTDPESNRKCAEAPPERGWTFLTKSAQYSAGS